MDSQHSSSLEKMTLDDTEDNPKMERIWEWCRIGSFDMDSWTKILTNLCDAELANVALVCKDFQTMARDIIARRYKTELFEFTFAKPGWKPVICRFGDVISTVRICGPWTTGPELMMQQDDFSYFERFTAGTLKDLTFYRVDTKNWKDIRVWKRFEKVEKLTFLMSKLKVQCYLTGGFHHYFPKIKFLALSHCSIGRCRFLEQSMPFMEETSFQGVSAVNSDFLLIFMIKNRQLKKLFVDLNHFPIESSMSCLPVVNEVLPNLMSLFWCCTDLTRLPNVRKNFDNIKVLGFNLQSLGKYKNELVKYIEVFPVVEELKVLHIFQNLMTNDDLIDLLTQSSTLKKIIFNSRGSELHMKFGYDLHRRVCEATSNRSDIEIEFEYASFTDDYKRFVISKNRIKQNGKIIVLSESLTR